MNTLLLAIDTWDLVLDAKGNIAVASAPYSLAQDVASACRTFLAEVWYDDTLGIPWDTQILAQNPPVSLLQEYLVKAALGAVPTTADVYVKAATVLIQSFNPQTREVIGQVQFVDSNGNTGSINL